jgi:hypothetical protein
MKYKSVVITCVVTLAIVLLCGVAFVGVLEYAHKIRSGRVLVWPSEHGDCDETGALTDAAVKKYSQRVLAEDNLHNRYSELVEINRLASVAPNASTQKPVVAQWKDSKANAYVAVRLDLQGHKVSAQRYFPK